MSSIRKKPVRKLLFLSLICLLALAAAMPVAAANPKWKQLKRKYAEKKNTNRLIFVKYEGGTNATLYMFRKKTRRNGTHYWKKFLKCKAYVGLNGLGKQREGDVKTPRGTFRLTEGFGIKENPGLNGLKYTKLNRYLYWSGEMGTYNTMVDSRVLGHAPSNSEHLLYCNPEYNYALNINYNRKHIYKKGSGIFLHCMGAKKYTHGCVAVSEINMIRIMQNTTSKTRICIYEK